MAGPRGLARRVSNERGNRVVPAAMPGMATQQPAHGEVATASQPEARDGLRCVGAARRREAARRWAPRADEDLPAADHPQRDPNRDAGPLGAHDGRVHALVALLTSRLSAWSRSVPSRADVAGAASGSARTTVPLPAGSVASRLANWPRSRRATRCRTTLPPTDLPTTSPTRGGWLGRSPARKCTTRHPRRVRAPCRTTAVKSSDRRIRFAAGNTSTDSASSKSTAGRVRPTACCGPCAGGPR